MNANPKIQPAHLQRWAYVYIRQSTAAQVAVNRESTDRQYRLRERALQWGWPGERIKVIDEDLAHSGSGLVERHGFTYLTSEVALGRAGLILSLEVSRVARNSADWYRLLDLCGVTDTLIGDKCEAIKNVKQPMEKPVESAHDGFSTSHFSSSNQLCSQRLQPPNQAGVLAPRGGVPTRLDDGLRHG